MILSAEDLSYSYGDRLLFENITFNVEEGDKYGIIGVNGTGKSTLLRMIASHEAGDGKLTIPGGVVMEYLPQDPPFEADATVLEQVFKGDSPLMVLLRDYETAVEQSAAEPDNKKLQKHLLDLQQQMDDKYAWQLESEAKAVLTQLGITNLQQQMGELSGGQRKRVALAGVLVRPSDLLILDEPTNHMDNATVAWLEQKLLARKGALLMVTHDRYFFDRVVNRTLEIDGARVMFTSVTTACFCKSVRNAALRRPLLRKSCATFTAANWHGSVVARKHAVLKRRTAWSALLRLKRK